MIRAAVVRPRFIFIGTSRVAQAVVAEAFIAELRPADAAALNLGRGYSTLVEHFFGLRRLAAASPSGLRGTIVLVEAPEGIPDPSSWDDPWFVSEDPGLLSMTMRPSDLPAFWARSAGSFSEKASITAAEVSSLASLRGSWSYYARAGWHSLTGGKASDGTEPTELSAAGGVRTSRAAFVAARRLAEAMSELALRDQRELTSQEIEQAVLLSLASFLKKEGASFVAFTMPTEQHSATGIDHRDRATESSTGGRRTEGCGRGAATGRIRNHRRGLPGPLASQEQPRSRVLSSTCPSLSRRPPLIGKKCAAGSPLN